MRFVFVDDMAHVLPEALGDKAPGETLAARVMSDGKPDDDAKPGEQPAAALLVTVGQPGAGGR